MKFKLPDFNLEKYPTVFAGQNKRHATATSVSFVTDNLILVASFLNKKIYLISIENGDFTIIDEITTNYCPDLIDYKDGLIITTGNGYGVISIFNFIDNKIVFVKDIVKKQIDQIHGCRIIDNDNVIVTNTSNNTYRGCFYVNINSGYVRQFNNFKHYPKDILIINDRILISSSSSRPSATNKVTVTDSILYLFEYPSLKQIDELTFYGQTDAVCLSGEDGFITLQAQDSLLHFKLIDDKLSFIKTIPGFSFPHGIASNDTNVIVTNYGDNSIDILPLSDLI